MRHKFISMLFATFSLVLLADTATAVSPSGKEPASHARAPPSHTATAVTSGKVDTVKGSCTVHRHVLRPGDGVQVNDVVEVPAGCKLSLRMVDGSQISIAANSSMKVLSYDIGKTGRHAKLSLTQGLLHAVVVAVHGPSTFEVSTAVGTASVTSPDADWFIEAQPGSARVGVEAGEIELTSATTGSSAKIPAKWGGTQMAGRDSAPPRRWPQDELDNDKDRTK